MSVNLKPLQNLVNQLLKETGGDLTPSRIQKTVNDAIKNFKKKNPRSRISRNDIIAIVFDVVSNTLKNEHEEEKAELFKLLGDISFSEKYYKNKTKELEKTNRELSSVVKNLEKTNKKLEEQKPLIAKQAYEIAAKGFLKTSAIIIGILVVGLILIKLLTRAIFKENVKISDIILFKIKNVFSSLKSTAAKIFVGVGIATVIIIAIYVAKKRLKINDDIIKAAIEGAEKAQSEPKK